MLINVETLADCNEHCPHMQISRYVENGEVKFECDCMELCNNVKKERDSLEDDIRILAAAFKTSCAIVEELKKER